MALRLLLTALRTVGSECSSIGAPQLRTASPLCTTLDLRGFSSESYNPSESGTDEQAADREARRQQVAARLMQGKSWRSWVERKLDETIAGKRI